MMDSPDRTKYGEPGVMRTDVELELRARIAELERRVKFLEGTLRCPNCLAIMEDRLHCIFCNWQEMFLAKIAELERELDAYKHPVLHLPESEELA